MQLHRWRNLWNFGISKNTFFIFFKNTDVLILSMLMLMLYGFRLFRTVLFTFVLPYAYVTLSQAAWGTAETASASVSLPSPVASARAPVLPVVIPSVGSRLRCILPPLAASASARPLAMAALMAPALCHFPRPLRRVRHLWLPAPRNAFFDPDFLEFLFCCV